MSNSKAARIHFPCEFSSAFLKEASAATIIDIMRTQIEHEVKCENWEMANAEIEIALRHNPGSEKVTGYAAADIILFP